jgi:UDP-N-acetylmuramate dehydrogenase
VQLQKTPHGLLVYRGEALRPYNTLALQAYAEAFVTVASDTELLSALGWARECRLPVVPLGQGSNIVVAGDLNALVLRQHTRGIQILETAASTVVLRIAAGEGWHELVRWSIDQGYYGLENLALIPGTVGAAPIQNIGAYGVELQSVLLQVHARQIADNQQVTLDATACEFGYRDSIFKHALKDELVITAIDIKLSTRANVKITYPALASFFLEHPLTELTPQAVFDAVVSIRRSKLPDPATEPNAGSFFKNPLVTADVAENLVARHPAIPCYEQGDGRVKLAAAWMIDRCGWKGFRQGGMGVHPEHALVLVNYGNSSGEQLLFLANDIARSVYDNFGVHLEIEPRVYGASA